jgi:hypothetical protein
MSLTCRTLRRGRWLPYATSHEALDEDHAFQQEVENAARALASAVDLARAGRLEDPGQGLADPKPK